MSKDTKKKKAGAGGKTTSDYQSGKKGNKSNESAITAFNSTKPANKGKGK